MRILLLVLLLLGCEKKERKWMDHCFYTLRLNWYENLGDGTYRVQMDAQPRDIRIVPKWDINTARFEICIHAEDSVYDGK